MILFRPLPWEYGVRNLFRRPGRSALTLAGLTLVVLLVFVVVGFIRGLEASLAVSGDPDVVIIHSLDAAENVESSSVPMARADELITALGSKVRHRYADEYASRELYLGTRFRTPGDETTSLGLVRGVTPRVALVRRQVQIIEGHWPGPGEVLVGRLAATKLGRSASSLA